MDDMHIVMGLHDGDGSYYNHAAVTMVSMFENTGRKIKIHLFHDETLDENKKEALLELAKLYSQSIEFYKIISPKWLNECKSFNLYSAASSFRFHIANSLPENIAKALYIDCDCIVEQEIGSLWDVNLEDKAVAAVEDSNPLEGINFYEQNFNEKYKNSTKYFNAGVMLYNLSKIRNKYNLLDDAFNFLKNYPEAPSFDQEAVNYLFKDDCIYLDKKYNYQVANREELSLIDKSEVVCWHFLTSKKPWNGSNGEIDGLYWKYFIKLPWCAHEERTILNLFKQIETYKIEYRNSWAYMGMFLKKLKNSNNIVVFGTGSTADNIISYLPKPISFFVDNDQSRWNKIKVKKAICDPARLLNEKKEDLIIVVASEYWIEIKTQLENYGLCETENFWNGLKIFKIFDKKNF